MIIRTVFPANVIEGVGTSVGLSVGFGRGVEVAGGGSVADGVTPG
ncbi:MAG: hypothetical protein C1O27_002662 [Chloroflexi bacterium]|jgi:hypothetical protein|nr:MAG: hypothetical protein C1O27_002662 [Chloroflexota bacterium]